jgi:very-short-patch-repair endonuclease
MPRTRPKNSPPRKYQSHVRYELTCAGCGNTFEHNYPRKKYRACPDCCAPRACKCGCGVLVHKPFSLYARGHDPAQHAHHATVMTGRVISDEVRRKLSIGHKRRLRDPKIRKQMSLAAKKAHIDNPNLAINKSRNCKLQMNKQSEPERLLEEILDGRIFKYAGLNKGKGPQGQPISADFVAPSVQLIVQVDGCYYHECPWHGLGMNPKRRASDKRLDTYAKAQGWYVLRIWEHSIRKNPGKVLEHIMSTYQKLKDSQ